MYSVNDFLKCTAGSRASVRNVSKSTVLIVQRRIVGVDSAILNLAFVYEVKELHK